MRTSGGALEGSLKVGEPPSLQTLTLFKTKCIYFATLVKTRDCFSIMALFKAVAQIPCLTKLFLFR